MSRKILIADTNSANRVELRMILQNAHYTLYFPDTLDNLRAHLQNDAIDIVLFSERFGELSPEEFCLFVGKNSPESLTGSVPAVLFARAENSKKRLKAFWDGVSDVIPYPFDKGFLLAYMRNYFRQRESEHEMKSREFYNIELGLSPFPTERNQTKKIGCFSNGTEQVEALIAGLKAQTPHHVIKRQRDGIIGSFEAEADNGDDVYVIFVEPENIELELSLIPELRSYRKTRFAALIVVLPYNAPQIAAMAFDFSANAVVFAPTTSEELVLRVLFQLERKCEADIFRAQRDEGLNLALRDPLTHLYNQRYIEHYTEHLQKQVAKSGRPFAVFMIDIDHFKAINDQFGHIAGDDILKAMGFRLNNNLRAPDIVGRVGGEEFLVIINTDNMKTAKRTANRILKSLSSQPFLLRSGEKIRITASIGIALNSKNKQSVEETIKNADKALYLAKEDGRNKIRTLPGARTKSA